MAIYKVEVKFNQQNLGSALNVYWFQIEGTQPTNTQIKAGVTNWIESIYAPLVPTMDAGCTFSSCRITVVDTDGNTIGEVGDITCDISGSQSGHQLTLVAAASAFARTLVGKIQGRKRFPGISEDRNTDGLFDNVLLNALAQAALEWVATFAISTFFGHPGVLSLSTGTFKQFTGTAVITNVPGTQVTRKPLRGS